MNSGLMRKLALGLLAVSLGLAAGAAVNAGVVSHYSINGETVLEGATFDELRSIAGDPLEVVELDHNPLNVEWVYQCSTAGAGPCRVVASDGRREMRARFQLGRLKIIRFERI